VYQLLSGLRIIEASSFVASPTAGLYLAQMGAEVIRIDQIGGGPDFSRWPKAANGASLYWENLNRAKKSVALDLAKPAGRELLQKLATAPGANAGIFLTNFPVDGFLSHERLSAMRPDLITVRIMGQANGGPALDYTVNSAVGLPDLTGPPSLGDTPVNHVLPAWDLLTGAYAAFALLAALRHRDATGQGQEVRIPLADIAIGSVANLGMLAEVMTSGENRPRLGNEVFGAFGRDFMTADARRLMIMAITPRQWSGLVVALRIGDEIAAIEDKCDISFAKDEGIRFEHRRALYPLVAREVAKRSYADLVADFDARGCCYGIYQTMRDAADDPVLVTHNPIFALSNNPSGLRYPAAGAFATLPNFTRTDAKQAPRLGEDSATTFAALLGLSHSDIAELARDGIVGVA
jgi:2-methylfumaryl-CoA isomerase